MDKILLIDDDAVTLKFLNQILIAQGFTCETEIDSLKAVEHAQAFKPDLIVTDFLMPNLSGVQVCKLLKADNDLKKIPIVFVAGSTEASTRVMALEAGAVDYMSKPVNPKELALRIRIHLDAVRARDKNV